MGMRGKKKLKPYTTAQKKLLKEFEAWCKEEIEKDFIVQCQKLWDEGVDIEIALAGNGCSQNLKGVSS